MPTRLVVLVIAAFLALLAFAPTASAQSPPPECQGVDTPEEFQACLEAIAQGGGGGGGGEGSPQECQNVNTEEEFEACLAAIFAEGGAPQSCQDLIEAGLPQSPEEFEQGSALFQECLQDLGNQGGGDDRDNFGDRDFDDDFEEGFEEGFDEGEDEDDFEEGFDEGFAAGENVDDGHTPRGSIASGAGGTSATGDDGKLKLAAGGLSLLAVAGLGTGAALRRRRST